MSQSSTGLNEDDTRDQELIGLYDVIARLMRATFQRDAPLLEALSELLTKAQFTLRDLPSGMIG